MESPRAFKRRKISTNGLARASSPMNGQQIPSLPSNSRSTRKTSRPTRLSARSKKPHDTVSPYNNASLLNEEYDGNIEEKSLSFVDSAYQSRTASRTTPDEPEEVSVAETPSRTLQNGKQRGVESGGQGTAISGQKQASSKKRKTAGRFHASSALRKVPGHEQLHNGTGETSQYFEPIELDTIAVRESSPLGQELETQSAQGSSPTKRLSGRVRRQTRKVQESSAQRSRRGNGERRDGHEEVEDWEGRDDKRHDEAKRKATVTKTSGGRGRRKSQNFELAKGTGDSEHFTVEDSGDNEEDTISDDGEPTFGELLGIHEPSTPSTKKSFRGRSNVSRPKQHAAPSNSAISSINSASNQGFNNDSVQLDLPLPTLSRSITKALPSSKQKGRLREAQLEESPSIAAKPTASAPKTSPLKLLQETLQNDPAAPKELEALKTRILNYLTGKQRLPLHGLETEYQKVHQLIEQTVIAGEGNSILLIGPRGSAKTNLVETAIARIGTQHREDFHVVRLNGFIHTDDKLALKDIWRQLGREMEVESDAAGAPSSYADNLTSILALLSHPTEHTAEEALAVDGIDPKLLTAKSVIFVIDEFDLFTSHSRQTLLYNLFDIAQARKAPIAVLGLTTRVDVVDSLEKRVKSRFSHRHVYISLAKSLHAFKEICTSALDGSEPPHDGRNPFGVRSLDLGPSKSKPGFSSSLRDRWRAYVDELFANDPSLNHLLAKIYATTKSVPEFLSASLMPMLSLSPTTIPTGPSFLSTPFFPPDSKLHILPSLADLELSLLIAAARLDIILDSDTCNFNMAYDEYVGLAEKAKLFSSSSGASALGGASKTWGREVAMGAWERLIAVELLVPATGGPGSGTDGGGGKAGRLWKADVGLEDIGEGGLELSAVMRRWCREI